MSSQISIAQMLAELEWQIAHHRQQEGHHAQQAVFHHEQRAFHAAELQTAEERFTAFRAAAEAAGELVERRRAATAPPPPGDEAFPGGTRGPVSRLVVRVAKTRRPEEVFGPTDLAREINQRYGSQLDRLLDGRTVSVTLRRLAANGQLHVVRWGAAHREALYTWTPPAARSR
jgi:hypothetical protein